MTINDYIEAMEGILKWVEKHPEEAKITFKDKLKDYFVDIRWEVRNFKIEEKNQYELNYTITKINNLIK